ncbi:MAG: hypothetical protein WC325_10275 [Candidatus Bathyarchaeia archaeon]
MKTKFVTFLGVVFCALILSGLVCSVYGAADSAWSHTYGGLDDDTAVMVIQTSDGGYAVLGTSFSFGAGLDDFWLVKVDKNGNMQWNQTYGGTGQDPAAALIQTTDGGYALAGTTNSYGAGGNDYWLVKTDKNGNVEWNQTYGGAKVDEAVALAQTADKGYALGGYTNSYGAGDWDYWLVKTYENGTVEWTQTYGGIAQDKTTDMIQTKDGGYALIGTSISFTDGTHWDMWVVKTDKNGNTQWNQTYGGTKDELAGDIIQTSDQGYALTGSTYSYGSGEVDFWLVKTDKNGNMQHNWAFGGTKIDEVTSVIQATDESYVMVGNTKSFGEGSWNAWLIKVDQAGTIVWETVHGTEEVHDGAACVIQASDGGFVVAGTNSPDVSSFWDYWLFKTDAQGIVPEFSVLMLVAFFVACGIFVCVIRIRMQKRN